MTPTNPSPVGNRSFALCSESRPET